mgnify:FL=1
MAEEKVETPDDEFVSQEQRDNYAKLEQMLEEVKNSEQEINLVKVLHRAQKIFGHVAREVQIRIAEGLDVPLSEVYSVVSFYSLFTTDARGQTTIEVCMGTACYVKGSEDILQELEEELGIAPGETTADGEYTLETTRCVGACGKAPVVVVGEDVHGGITPEEVETLINN